MAQQIGLQYTTAGKGGFITALYILIVPLLGLAFGRKAGKSLVRCYFGSGWNVFPLRKRRIFYFKGDWIILAGSFALRDTFL